MTFGIVAYDGHILQICEVFAGLNPVCAAGELGILRAIRRAGADDADDEAVDQSAWGEGLKCRTDRAGREGAK
jgi:hypothetical protein